jgi:hypothetical protein
MADKIILTSMEVTMGKYTVVFPFFTIISPGSLPICINCMRNPTTKMIAPNVIRIFGTPFILLVPPFENADKPD